MPTKIPPPLTCSAKEQRFLLDLAHSAIRAAVLAAPTPDPSVQDIPDTLQVDAATFVTLLKRGRLRGCIGNLEPRDPLYRSVANNAVGAALRDPRFPPVTLEETAGLHVHLSVLGSPCLLDSPDPEVRLAELSPGRDGVILKGADRRATFLPQVWESIPDKVAFLQALAKKAGLGADAWQSSSVELWRYRVTSFGDPIS